MLKELCSLCATSGYEYEVINYITQKLESNNIEYEIDNVDNIIVKQGENPKKTALFAHMDEVGFGVKGITDEGLIKFVPIGGVCEKILPSGTVMIGDKKINGVIGNIPKHLKTKGDPTELKIDDFFIDIGAINREDAMQSVSIGDPIYWQSDFVEFGDDLIKAKALDDRVGVSIILSLLLEKKYSFTACFVTREEIGTIGSKTVVGTLKADKAIVLEVTTCADMPNITEKTTVLGNGVALSVMDGGSVADLELNEKIINVARKNKIPLQRKLTVRGGNDARSTSFYSGGIKTAVLSLPGRYIHSPTTVISKSDYNSAYELAKKILEENI